MTPVSFVQGLDRSRVPTRPPGRAHRLDGVPMTAKYATACGVCSTRIQPGEEIARAGNGWAHAACAGGSAGPEPAAGGAGGTTRTVPAARRRPVRPDMPALDGALEVWTDGACSGNP